MTLRSDSPDKIPVEVKDMTITSAKSNVVCTVLSLEGNLIEIDERNADQALEYALDYKGIEIDPVYEKKLVRKIDCYILPIIVALMSCQLMDKTTNSYAAIMGMKTDLNMSSQQYSWVGSSFYFGYLVFEFPANVLLQKFPLSKTLGVAVVLWGVILMCHAACQSSAPFLVCRVLLGIFEGFMNPAYIILTGQWYKTNEQFMRSCVWFGFQGFGTIMGAGIAYGLYHHSYGIASWRLLYIITGVITIFLGAVSILHVPDIPVKAWFLNDLDKAYCVERIRGNQQGFGNKRFKKEQLIEALTDIRTLLFFIYGISYSIPNGGFTNFGSILLKQDFGFPTDQALLMNMPGGGIDIVMPFLAAFISVKFFNGQRLILILIINTFVIVGMCCLAFTSPKGSRLFGYLTFYCATAVVSGMISCISSNTAGRTKKIAVNTVFLVGYCAGNIIGPQSFRANQAPGYAGAKIAMLISFCAAEFCILAMYLLNKRDNRIRDEKRAAMADNYEIPEYLAFSDLTDKENPEFRYSL